MVDFFTLVGKDPYFSNISALPKLCILSRHHTRHICSSLSKRRAKVRVPSAEVPVPSPEVPVPGLGTTPFDL